MTTISTFLLLPFRKSTHLSLWALRCRISSISFGVAPTTECGQPVPRPRGIKTLQAYTGQLVWIGGKFPIDMGAEFTWYSALGYNTERRMVRNNLKYELMNILYNLASLYSKLAVALSRGKEGLKTAAGYIALAAGVLDHIRKEILPELRMSDPPEDVDADTLESLSYLLLAQSQECFWQKEDPEAGRLCRPYPRSLEDLVNRLCMSLEKAIATKNGIIPPLSEYELHLAGEFYTVCDAGRALSLDITLHLMPLLSQNGSSPHRSKTAAGALHKAARRWKLDDPRHILSAVAFDQATQERLGPVRFLSIKTLSSPSLKVPLPNL
ncbi:BRO1-like domain-containing protein [Colletotrichum navitas]|uniref:BRO1-like domain-containing protein n=1 Tax=Colletotrichum navitas TaxID=681940 RepID=A0AAD8UYG2_9PEZI|nr:BRO1-like domain-containing protein [Colletotrichum navitas]KAK1570091.1 BRO1-like domain-containing protein [Colletotrichum navitas]